MRAALLILAFALSCAGDVVWLKNGGKLEGKVTDQGDTLDLQTKSGAVMHLKKADIDHIEAKPFEVEPKKDANPPPEPKDKSLLGDAYDDPFTGFSITFPRGWRRAPNDKSLVVYAGASDQGFAPRIQVASFSAQGTLEQVTGQLKQSLKEVESEGEKKLVGAGTRKAWEILGNMPFPGKQDVMLECVFTTVAMDRGQYFLIQATCRKDSFTKLADALKASIDSFTVTSPVSLTDDQKRELNDLFAKAREATAAGKDQDAIEAYKKALALVPSHVDLHHNLAGLYLKTKQVNLAIQEYQVLTSLKPGNADYHYLLGTLYSQVQKYEDAAASFKKAIDIDPEHGDAWNNLGTVLLAKGDVPGGIEAFKRAAELQPKDASAMYNLGQAYEAAGKRDAAREAYQKALAIDPNHDKAKKALEKLDQQK